MTFKHQAHVVSHQHAAGDPDVYMDISDGHNGVAWLHIPCKKVDCSYESVDLVWINGIRCEWLENRISLSAP